MDLGREILKRIEECPEADGYRDIGITIPEHSEQEISYHIMQLAEAGLIKAVDLSTRALASASGIRWKARRLTFAGHEFLNAYRQDTLWKKAKKLAVEKTGSLSFEALKQVIPIVIKSIFGG